VNCTGNPLRKKLQKKKKKEQRKKKRRHSDRERKKGYLENRRKALGLFNLREMAVPAVPIPFQRRNDVSVVNVIGATARETGVLAALIGKNGMLGLNRAAPTQKKVEIGFVFLGLEICATVEEGPQLGHGDCLSHAPRMSHHHLPVSLSLYL
jgi:hypothetical protein